MDTTDAGDEHFERYGGLRGERTDEILALDTPKRDSRPVGNSIVGRWFILAVYHDGMTDAEWVAAGAGGEPDWSVVADTDRAEPGDYLMAERFAGSNQGADVELFERERRALLLRVLDYNGM